MITSDIDVIIVEMSVLNENPDSPSALFTVKSSDSTVKSSSTIMNSSIAKVLNMEDIINDIEKIDMIGAVKDED